MLKDKANNQHSTLREKLDSYQDYVKISKSIVVSENLEGTQNRYFDEHNVLDTMYKAYSGYVPMFSKAAWVNIIDERLSNAPVENVHKAKKAEGCHNNIKEYIKSEESRMTEMGRIALNDDYRRLIFKTDKIMEKKALQKENVDPTPEKESSRNKRKMTDSDDDDIIKTAKRTRGRKKKAKKRKLDFEEDDEKDSKIVQTPKRLKQEIAGIDNDHDEAGTKEEGYSKTDRRKSPSQRPRYSYLHMREITKANSKLTTLLEDGIQINTLDSGYIDTPGYYKSNEVVSAIADAKGVESVIDFESISSLDDTKWLSQGAVDFLSLLFIKNVYSDIPRKLHLINTYKASFLFKLGDDKSAQIELSKDDINCIIDLDTIVIAPILYRSRSHFCLSIADNKNKKFYYVDPQNDEEASSSRIEALNFMNMYVDIRARHNVLDSWQSEPLYHPKQMDTYSCGPMILNILERYISSLDQNDYDKYEYNREEWYDPKNKEDMMAIRYEYIELVKQNDQKNLCKLCYKEVSKSEGIPCVSCKRMMHSGCKANLTKNDGRCPPCTRFLAN